MRQYRAVYCRQKIQPMQRKESLGLKEGKLRFKGSNEASGSEAREEKEIRSERLGG